MLFSAQTGKNTRYAEYIRRSSVIAPRILGCARVMEFSAHKGILAHPTGETGPKRSKLLKNVNKMFEISKKQYFSKADTKNLAQFLVC